MWLRQLKTSRRTVVSAGGLCQVDSAVPRQQARGAGRCEVPGVGRTLSGPCALPGVLPAAPRIATAPPYKPLHPIGHLRAPGASTTVLNPLRWVACRELSTLCKPADRVAKLDRPCPAGQLIPSLTRENRERRRRPRTDWTRANVAQALVGARVRTTSERGGPRRPRAVTRGREELQVVRAFTSSTSAANPGWKRLRTWPLSRTVVAETSPSRSSESSATPTAPVANRSTYAPR
jgi:hypothetical protein